MDIIVRYKRIGRRAGAAGGGMDAMNNSINLSNECVLSCKWLKN